MTMKSDVIAKSTVDRLLKYRFTLSSTGYTDVVFSDLDGWFDGGTQFERNENHGIDTELVVNELTFLKDAAKLLYNIFTDSDIEGECTFKVERFNSTYRAYETRYTGNVDFKMYSRNGLGVTVRIIQDDFLSRVKMNWETEVNLHSTYDLYGGIMVDYKSIALRIRADEHTSDAVFAQNENLSNTTGDELMNPCTMVSSELENAATQTNTNTNIYIHKDNKRTRFYIEGTATGQIERLVSSGTAEIKISALVYDESNTLKSTNVLFYEVYASTGIHNYSYSFNIDFDLFYAYNDTGEGWYIKIVEDVNNTKSSTMDLDFELKRVIYEYPQSDIKALNLYQAIFQAIRCVTGSTTATLVDNSSTLEKHYITTGKYIRGGSASDSGLVTSLKKLVEYIRMQEAVGVSISSSGIEISKIDSLYLDSEVLDLSDSVSIEDVEQEVIPEKYYNNIKIGFNNFADKELLGASLQYCTWSKYVARTKNADSDLQIMTDYRADSIGIWNLLENAYPTGTFWLTDEMKDIDGQDDIFVFHAFSDSGTWTAALTEDYSLNSGGVKIDERFNNWLQPQMAFQRVMKNYTPQIDVYYTFQEKLKIDLSNPVMLGVTSFPVYYISDKNAQTNYKIGLNDYYIQKPNFSPYLYRFEAVLTYDQFVLLKANLYKYITFADGLRGYIKKLSGENEEGKFEFELIKKA